MIDKLSIEPCSLTAAISAVGKRVYAAVTVILLFKGETKPSIDKS